MRNLRIKLNSISFKNPPDLPAWSNVAISIKVNSTRMGVATDRWAAGPRTKLSFDAAKYSTTINVEGRTQPLELYISPSIDEPGNQVAIGGPINTKIPWPYSPRVLTSQHATGCYIVEWAIESRPQPPRPSGIFSCREDASGAVLYNTVGNVQHKLRVEVHEVLPTPFGDDQDETGPGPNRPVLVSQQPWVDGKGKTGAEMSAGSDLNIIENPAVIPILPANSTANATNCAKFKVTYYWPKSFNFTADDSRLEWRVVSTGGGDATFFGRKTGRQVALHGKTEGELHLEVRFENTQVAIYRALVKPLITIPFRCTILSAYINLPAYRPRSTPADIRSHILIANRFLWQVGLKLEAFNSTATGWRPQNVSVDISPVQGQKGFFTARVPAKYTRDVSGDDVICAAFNSLPYVFNFAYIKSYVDHDTLGMGCYMDQAGADTIIDSGTPSTSWITPSGINPDRYAKPVKMTCMPKHNIFRDNLFPHRFAMYVSDLNLTAMSFGGTIAHELGHVLGLNHRIEGGDDYDDMVRYPRMQNLMHWAGEPDYAQDLDIIQAKQVRLSPLLVPPAGGRPAPAP